MKKLDIKIKQIEYIPKTNILLSKLVLNFSGKDIHMNHINSLRIVAMDFIPTYAFPRELITISKNSTVFNNDQLKFRLSQLPILNVNHNLSYLDDQYIKNVDFEKRIIHPEEQQIVVYINVKNDTNNFMHIQSRDLLCTIDGEKSLMYKKLSPLSNNKYTSDLGIFTSSLIKLRPDDELNCSLKACLGIGDINKIWSQVSVAASTYGDDNKEIDDQDESILKNVDLMLESIGQINEYDILIKSCDYIIYKLDLIDNYIDKNINEIYKNGTYSVRLELSNTGHEIGNIISYELQINNNIKFSGDPKYNKLEKKIEIKFETIDKDITAISEFKKVKERLINIYNHIKSEFITLKNALFKSKTKN